MTERNTRSQAAWTTRFILGQQPTGTGMPDWFPDMYERFRHTLLTNGYPCYFGQNAVRGGDLFLTAISAQTKGHLPQTLSRFLGLSKARPRRRNNLAVFWDPAELPADHTAFQESAWGILQYLHDRDPAAGRACPVNDPESPLWEFPFDDSLFFVVGLSPTYQHRRSRNVCSGVVLLFQPRDVFEDADGVPIGDLARAEVRRRLALWDGATFHPDLGTYGDPTNREWKQYFLPDESRPTVGVCPLQLQNIQPQELSNPPVEEFQMKTEELVSTSITMTQKEVINHLANRISDFIERTPFFHEWIVDRVTKESADRFLLAFDHLVGSFPALIAVGISRMSEAGRVVLAENLYQECGFGDQSRTHHAIYRSFLDSVGLDWRNKKIDYCTTTWRTMLWHHTLDARPASSVGAIAAGEFLAQPALERIYEVLKQYYPEADVEYFTTHLELETEHVEEIAELIAAECTDTADYEAMVNGFEAGLRCWGEWFAGVSNIVFCSERAA